MSDQEETLPDTVPDSYTGPNRTEVVRVVATEMLRIAQNCPTITAGELYSAGLSYLATMLPLLLKHGAEPEALRNGLHQLLVLCAAPDEKGRVM